MKIQLSAQCRIVDWLDIRDLHILQLGSFSAIVGTGLMAKEFDQNWLWSFVALQFMTIFNVTGYDGDVECFSDFDNSILCSRIQVFRNPMNFKLILPRVLCNSKTKRPSKQVYLENTIFVFSIMDWNLLPVKAQAGEYHQKGINANCI